MGFIFVDGLTVDCPNLFNWLIKYFITKLNLSHLSFHECVTDVPLINQRGHFYGSSASAGLILKRFVKIPSGPSVPRKAPGVAAWPERKVARASARKRHAIGLKPKLLFAPPLSASGGEMQAKTLPARSPSASSTRAIPRTPHAATGGTPRLHPYRRISPAHTFR